jgi:hypothetical protein
MKPLITLLLTPLLATVCLAQEAPEFFGPPATAATNRSTQPA